MQIKTLLMKELRALFKQKAIIFTLLIPMLLIVGLGILPTIIGTDQPVEVGYLNQDQGIKGLTLGDKVIKELNATLSDSANIELKPLNSTEDFENMKNAFWLPKNFSSVANATLTAKYYHKYSSSDLRAESILENVIAGEVKTIVRETLIEKDLPEIQTQRVFAEGQVTSDGSPQNRAQIAFPLAYMAFLILILSTGFMRITGFSKEKESGMMELLLSSVVDRKELILSKLLAGVIYGIATVLSYVSGILIVYFVQGNSTPNEEVSLLIFAPELLSPFNILLITLLLINLSFISIQILLSAQLLLGREAGDRVGSMCLMILAFLFYFASIGDPLSEGLFQILNPFFWSFRLTLNLIFQIEWMKSLMYFLLNFSFSYYLLKLKTNAIEKEKVLFE